MPSQTDLTTTDDEIDLRELFSALWSGKIWIFLSTSICAVLAVLYALSLKPEYEARSVFELKSSGAGSRFPGELGGLASLAGINVGGGSDGAVLDRLAGRDFVARLSEDVSLDKDPVFVGDGDAAGFSPRAYLRRLIVADGETTPTEGDPLDGIFEAYSKLVAVQSTKNGSFEVKVTHEDPVRAAVIANAIVDRLVSETSGEKRREDLERLNYLSEQLAAAATQMEDTSQAVSEFALANSLSAPGAFAQRSEEIYQLNEQRRRSLDMIRAAKAMLDVLAANVAPSVDAYEALKEEHSIVDDVEFRRLLGVSESLTQWQWPNANRLLASLNVLNERVARSESRLAELNREAERYAKSSEQLMILKRDAAVAEATYQVLIEQVKAQSLVSGFEGETVRIYQSATPPAKASAPRKSLIAALGVVLGGFLGCAIALLRSMLSGRIYTRSALVDVFGPKLSVNIPYLSKVKKTDAKQFADQLKRLTPTVGFQDLAVAARKSGFKQGLFVSFSKKDPSLVLALALADELNGSQKGAVLVLNGAAPDGLEKLSKDNGGDWIRFAWKPGVEILTPSADVASTPVKRLDTFLARSQYDCVFLAVSGDLGATVARLLPSDGTFVTVIAQAGITTRGQAARLRAAKDVDAQVLLS